MQPIFGAYVRCRTCQTYYVPAFMVQRDCVPCMAAKREAADATP